MSEAPVVPPPLEASPFSGESEGEDDPLLRLVDAFPEPLAVVQDGRLLFLNQTLSLLLGLDTAQGIGTMFVDLVREEDREILTGHLSDAGRFWELTARLAGSERPVIVKGSVAASSDAPVALLSVRPGPGGSGLLVDGPLRSVLDQMPFPIMMTSPMGVIEYVNPAFLRNLGYEAHEVLGRTPRFLKSGTMNETIYEKLWADLAAGRQWSGEIQNRRKDGSLIWERTTIVPLRDATGAVVHYMAVHEDISQRKAAESRSWHHANHDALTGLPNRILLRDRMTLAVAHARRAGSRVAVLLVDLDHFKVINDTLGPIVGDTLLCQVTQRLRECLRDTDTLARVGGDEFLILLVTEGGVVDQALVARRILEALRRPFVLDDGQDVMIGGSIGITVSPDDGESVDELMRNADTALARAKESGRNTYQFFTSEMNREVQEQISLEGALRRAVRNMDLTVHYQPVVDSQTLLVVGTEALIRWPSAEGGFVSPTRFIPVAEDLGLMEEIGAWVLWTACTQARQWLNRVPPGFRMAVNLSWRQLRNPDFPQRVVEVLEGTGVPASVLELEVSEATLSRDPKPIGRTLQALKECGVSLTIDNFGSGHGSMKTLRAYPFGSMKLDRHCVADMLTRHEDAVLVETAILMARRLGLRVVAEGVETEAQLAHLRAQYCDLIQGFLFGHPLAPEDLVALL
ncbi:putative bifunctional diguanylate cyclase/phosphodiesterase [Pararhodospirillum photometricum]|uniref:Diguanylate cyclase/phosphodiesterase n=1 Tax=Pararhodospirillum photometricum DSM 122 TaxID=1150469 RepID=H6SS18_PARPM|nr:EAL domain-containing protein [Pararhodospirillum photometricum]CCG07697.1 Diguanylate cyclase/phosphodiesterase [Pararhodospirillum photometricum DSM 122]